MSKLVTLSWPEQLAVAQAGVMRQIIAIGKRRKQSYGKPRDEWGVHIEGCGAEYAVAKLLGRFWTPAVPDLDRVLNDVEGLEVRSTKRKDGRLILHDRDPDDAPFVLVCGQMPEYNVIGWITGGDGKQEEFLFDGDGRPAYFVPQIQLRDLRDLPLPSGLPAEVQ